MLFPIPGMFLRSEALLISQFTPVLIEWIAILYDFTLNGFFSSSLVYRNSSKPEIMDYLWFLTSLVSEILTLSYSLSIYLCGFLPFLIFLESYSKAFAATLYGGTFFPPLFNYLTILGSII